jgi:hypothetical protein
MLDGRFATREAIQRALQPFTSTDGPQNGPGWTVNVTAGPLGVICKSLGRNPLAPPAPQEQGEQRFILEWRTWFNCEMCGKQFHFESRNPPRKYCSYFCYMASRSHLLYQLTCIECGESFTAARHIAKYCSPLCRTRYDYKHLRHNPYRKKRGGKLKG